MKLKRAAFIVLLLAAGVGAWFRLHWKAPLPETSTTESEPSKSGPARHELSQLIGTPARVAIPPSSGGNGGAVSSVQIIVDPQENYLRRHAAVDTIATNIAPSDWTSLQSFLLQKNFEDEDQLGQVLKNRLLDRLCELIPPPAGLGDVLTQMYRDRGQDVVMRDYAVQHLAAYYEQLELVSLNDPQVLRTIEGVLWEALGETDNSIAGTALLALDRLSRENTDIDRKRIGAVALQLARNENAGELARISAFQICGRMGIDNAEPTLSDAASAGKTMAIRISAIGALGALGNVQAKSLLRGFMNGDDDRLQLPAQRALMEIERQAEQKVGKPEI